MTGTVERERLWGGVTSAELGNAVAAVENYLAGAAGCFASLPDADLIAELHELEILRRRLAALDHLLLPELGRRNLAVDLGYGTIPRFLQAALRLSPRQAAARTRAADTVGPRTGLTGEALPPVLPAVGAAAAAGEISGEHVDALCRVLDEVPSDVPVDDFARVEQVLTEAARSLPPKGVADVGRRLIAYLDPDGRAPSEDDQRRHRGLSITERPDGSVEGLFHLTGSAGAKLIAVLDAQSAPRPAADGAADPRTYRQRMADALEDVCDLALRTGQIVAGGPSVQLIITMTAEQVKSGRGHAQTSRGQLLGVQDALLLAHESDVLHSIVNARGVVLDFGRQRRCASRSQTLALHSRDKGCSFPGCTKPTEWCQRHHVLAWVEGGRTDLENLTLVCSQHHREFRQRGWECVMREGLPWWIPPAHIDPARRPRQNQRIAQVPEG
jgi:hypothetical protein